VTTPFVGREAELAALTADLDAAVAGRGGVVLLAGEPGIGKTRLAEELAAQARARRPGAVGPLLGGGGCAGVLAVGPGRPRLRPGR
jgi:transcriptional regulator with AAA-type ATPase domain